jgi:thiol-disulfide isomerase/thioredoxin
MARWLVLAWGLLIAGHGTAAHADSTEPSLLEPLDLVSYPGRTTPPPFSGGTVDGRQVSMTALRGKVVLVNFWASWCPECRPEMPVFERLHLELGTYGFAVVGVNVRETKDAVARYAKELGLTFPLVLDPDGKIGALYGAAGLPATFLVGRDGRAVGFAIGSREWGRAPARALLNALLAEPPPRLAGPVRIGALTESWGPTTLIVGLRDGLQELGYREDRDFTVGVRFTQGDPGELPAAARDLVRLGVDLIVAGETSNAARAAQMATDRIRSSSSAEASRWRSAS